MRHHSNPTSSAAVWRVQTHILPLNKHLKVERYTVLLQESPHDQSSY